jgi:hypothetical protein
VVELGDGVDHGPANPEQYTFRRHIEGMMIESK